MLYLLFFYSIYLSQVADEEFLAAQHFLLVALSQVVEICKLVERRVTAREGGGSRKQQRVEGNQLPNVQLTLPGNKEKNNDKWSQKLPRNDKTKYTLYV